MQNRNLKTILSLGALILFMIVIAAYLFRDIKIKQGQSALNLYSILPSRPNAILKINKVRDFAQFIDTSKVNYKLFNNFIPSRFLQLIKSNPDVNEFVFGFYENGVVCCTKAKGEDILRRWERPSNRTIKKTIENDSFMFYPAEGRTFIGKYEDEDVCILSYSSKLLRECVKMKRLDLKSPPANQEHVLEKLDSKAPLNLLIYSNILDLYVGLPDSSKWRIKERWLGADFIFNNGKMCSFAMLPYSSEIDTLYYMLADTLNNRLQSIVSGIKIETKIHKDENQVFFSSCIK